MDFQQPKLQKPATPDTGYQMPDTRYWLPDAGYRIRKIFLIFLRHPVAGNRQLV
jgi:hypothetical protein